MRLSRPRSVPAVAGTTSLFAGSFPAPGAGGSQDLTGSGDSTKYNMGTHVKMTAAGTVTGVSYFVPTAVQPTNPDFGVGLYLADPTTGPTGVGRLVLVFDAATAPTSGAAGTWVTFTLSTPQSVDATNELYVVVRTNRYAVSGHVFDTGKAGGDGLVTGPADSGTFPNGAFTSGVGIDSTPPNFPATSFNASFYGVDVVFQAA